MGSQYGRAALRRAPPATDFEASSLDRSNSVANRISSCTEREREREPRRRARRPLGSEKTKELLPSQQNTKLQKRGRSPLLLVERSATALWRGLGLRRWLAGSEITCRQLWLRKNAPGMVGCWL